MSREGYLEESDVFETRRPLNMGKLTFAPTSVEMKNALLEKHFGRGCVPAEDDMPISIRMPLWAVVDVLTTNYHHIDRPTYARLRQASASRSV